MSKLVKISFYFVFGFAAFNWLGWPFELRFSESHLNYYFIALLCTLLPITLFFKLLGSRKNRNLIAATLASLSLGFFCIIIGTFAFSDAKRIYGSKVDSSFETIGEIEHYGSFYRLYRTDGGATTSFGLVLRKESKDFIGIKLVQRIFSKYKASEAEMNIAGANIELKIQPYSKDGEVEFVSVEL